MADQASLRQAAVALLNEHAKRYALAPAEAGEDNILAAAVFMTPRMSLKRMLSPREWPWQAGFNHVLPVSFSCARPNRERQERRCKATRE